LIAKQEVFLEEQVGGKIDFPLAGFKSAGVIVEIMNEDGSMARLPNWPRWLKNSI
jgi:3,4-dihydroxy 2-butanone 4-phosphate synthase/GTP cyclohydrolase II